MFGYKERPDYKYNIYNSDNKIICTVENNKIKGLIEGQCYIEAEISETTNYLASKSNQLTIKIVKRDDNQITIIPSNILYYGIYCLINRRQRIFIICKFNT